MSPWGRLFGLKQDKCITSVAKAHILAQGVGDNVAVIDVTHCLNTHKRDQVQKAEGPDSEELRNWWRSESFHRQRRLLTQPEDRAASGHNDELRMQADGSATSAASQSQNLQLLRKLGCAAQKALSRQDRQSINVCF